MSLSDMILSETLLRAEYTKLQAVNAELVSAIQAMLPEKVGYGESLDYHAYYQACKLGRAAIAKAIK